VPPGKRIAATVNVGTEEVVAAVEAQAAYFARLAGVEDLTVGVALEKPAASAVAVVERHEVFVPLAGMIDLDEERQRLQKEIDQKSQFLGVVERKLRNDAFVSRAPAEVVAKERQKAEDAKVELAKLRFNLHELDT
jgi:valyl-tRNA synthetase